MNDEQIRARFDEWASPLRLVPPPEVSQIRQRARRHTVTVVSATGSALGMLALAGVVVFMIVTAAVSGGGTGGPAVHAAWGSGRYPAPAGDPYLVLVHESEGTAQLVNEASGTVMKTLVPLAAAGFTWAAATPRDRLFVLAAQNTHDSLSFAELRIAPSGRPQPLRRVLPDVILTAQVYAMAVSPDGGRLAIATMPAAGGGAETVRVYDLASGVLAGEWTDAGAQAASLSFGPDGQLGIGWRGPAGSASGLRILDTSTGRGDRPLSLRADSELVTPIAGFQSASLSADGTRAIAVRAGPSAVTVATIDVHTGKTLSAVPIGPASALATAYYCGVLWASQNGSDLITQCGRQQELITNGHATRTRLAEAMLASPTGLATTFSW
jgi:hypothetical protein